MAKLSSEKYNILLIILIFIIPLISLDISFGLISKINNDLEEKKQENEAVQEAETLAAEGNFSTEFGIHFREFFDVIQNVEKLDIKNNSFLPTHLKQSSDKIFENPFPKYNLYVFKIPNKTKQAELIFYEGSISTGKRILCKTFEHLYNLNNDIEDKANDNIAKTLLGKFTNITAIAKEMRGIATNSNGIHKASWFIWDYVNIGQEGIYGAFLLCEEIEDQAKHGRLLALKRLKFRGKTIGAFIPVYNGYGEADIQYPLEKSKLFKDWADSLTIKNIDELDHWLMNFLPQNHKLGNYSAFCHLERNSSHIAVVLVKSKKVFYAPKWIVVINFIVLFSLLVILYSGISFGIWPQLKLRTRFILSYALASIVPLSLLSVIAYAYLLEYENTSEELEKNNLQLTLKDLDSYKLTNIREYKTTFNKVINDPKLKELIKINGVKSELVTDYVVSIFQNDDPDTNLPILGAKIYNEIGEGAFSNVTASNSKDVKKLINSLDSVHIDILRDEILKENPGLKLKDYNRNEENDLAKNAFSALTGRELKDDMNNHFSLPIPRKNGDFCGYHIFDKIKIDGKTKYLLLVLWDDKKLDERIIKNAINNNSLKKKNQSFIAYKINGQKLDPVGKKARADEDLLNKIEEKAKQSSYFKKTNTFIYKDNLIVIMPALNFNQTIFVGWVNKIHIISDLFDRKITFTILILISIFTIWICSIRSSSVFLKPITLLKNALDEVSLGNLNIGFIDNPNNELGKVSNEFGKMIEELREKERLSKLISDQAVQALKKNSNGLLNDTEKFKAVALVSDIRNFTGMSEKYDPEIITELLNEHFAEMAKIIQDNGGLIYKFIGDAIEAVFPEKIESEESASERAFKAACMMITKLKFINSHRGKIGLFPYKIGVGLCYGTLYSGSVGSIETRLDYSLIGDPLKKAAKYEALTIQNPDFPLTLDEIIAEKMAGLGLGFRKIDSKGQNFTVYTLDKIGNISNNNFSFTAIRKNLLNENKAEIEKINNYSLAINSTIFNISKDLLFYSFLVLFISLLITFGINILYDTTFKNLKSESDVYANRLFEQLKCDDVLKSAFETLCLEFYDDIRKTNFQNNPQNLKQKIESIAKKYEKYGAPIPKYCCCFLDKNKIPENESIIYHGFSSEVSILMNDYAKTYKKFINRKVDESVVKESIKKFSDKSTRFYNMHHGIHFRRSALALVGDEELFFDTERIYDVKQKNLIAYIFCGMPKNIKKDTLPYYYSLLSGKQMLLALKDEKGWCFSPGFPEKEKQFFINKLNYNNIKNKGYKYENIKTQNGTFTVYTISRDLFDNYYPSYKLNIISFITTFIILVIIFWLFEKNKIFAINSIATILRKDIFLSAILPILIVCFVFYLFVLEESNVKKAELIFNLNKQINDLESREFYYSSFCNYLLKNLHNYKDIKDNLERIKNTKDKERKEECNSLSDNLKNKIVGTNYKNNIYGFKSTDPYITIKEIFFVGKDGWIASAIENNNQNKKSSPFGDLFSKIVKAAFFDRNNNINKKVSNEDLSGEYISEKLLEVLSSAYGNEVALKATNLPNNLIIVSNTFTSIGVYIGCFPEINNPDYILGALIYFENDFKSYVCNKRNDNLISYKEHLASGSVDNKLFCFYSPNINVGVYFFYDTWFKNRKEDVKTVKELCLASSWINSSYLPLSKKVDIKGKHLLEARQGNFVKDTVYASLGSEYPIKANKNNRIKSFAQVILFSLLIIFLIAQSIISDLLDPVKQLINGAIEVSKGNYKFRINFLRKDEFGTLCFSFDKMMKGLEEKQLMNRMVSKTALKVASNLSEIQSKKEEVILLYISIPNFDKIMKNTPSYELFAKLRKHIASISEIIIDNGGDIDKIMGEKLLIAFHINDSSIKEVAIKVSKIAKLIATNDSLSFDVSVGVNSGLVISGYLGVGEKRDFTIIGDPVNVAARIESQAEKLETNRCLISETFYNIVRESVNAELFGEVGLKGKSEPMKVYQLF